MKEIRVFDFFDYRRFLQEALEARLASGNISSLRELVRRAGPELGIKSQGHLSLILQNKANISPALGKKLCRYLDLGKAASEYFLLLVTFNQSKSHSQRRKAFDRLIQFPESILYRARPQHYRFYGKWYHAAIRALCEYFPVQKNYDEVARLLRPAIRPDQVRASLELMESLELIEKDEKGFYRPLQKSLETGSRVQHHALNEYAMMMLDHAKLVQEVFPSGQRRFGWLSVGTDAEGYKQILQAFREFRHKAAQIAQSRPAEQVHHFQFQIFPMTKNLARKQKPGGKGK